MWRGLIQGKEVTNQNEQFLELFSRTLNFFAPQRCENIIVYYYFDRTRLFWPNAQCHLQGLNKLFLHLMRAPYLCIIINRMIFSRAIWNKRSLVKFSDLIFCTHLLYGFLIFWHVSFALHRKQLHSIFAIFFSFANFFFFWLYGLFRSYFKLMETFVRKLFLWIPIWYITLWKYSLNRLLYQSWVQVK